MLKQSETFNTNVAKNVIIFIGDGMSLPTVYSARLYKALYEANQQNPPQEDVNVEGSLLTFETFPHAALIKVTLFILSAGSHLEQPRIFRTGNACESLLKIRTFTGIINWVANENDRQ